jgi:hypothetical protein
MPSFFDDLDKMKVGWFLGLKQVTDEDITDVQEAVDSLQVPKNAESAIEKSRQVCLPRSQEQMIADRI